MFLTSKKTKPANLPVYLRGIPKQFLTKPLIAEARASYERKQQHRLRMERCEKRFRVLELDQLRGLPVAKPETLACGVYFLWNGPQLVYIGKGIYIHDRLAEHRRTGKRYTRATYETLNEHHALWCEAQYIRRYQPVLNIMGRAWK